MKHTPDVLILEVVRRRTPLGERRHRGAGYREYLPGLEILPCVRPSEAKILSVTGEQGPRNSPVAGLARDGLTNREIGSWLLVSRTVQTHVPHILRKTGLESPVPITRLAETQFRQQRMSHRPDARRSPA